MLGIVVLIAYAALMQWTASWVDRLQVEAALGRQCIEQSSKLISISNSITEGVFEVTRDIRIKGTVGALKLMANSPASTVLTLSRKGGYSGQR